MDVGQVHGDDLAVFHLLQSGTGNIWAAGGNDDPDSGGRQSPGGLQAEPGVAPGHHGRLAGEIEAGHDVLGGGGSGEGRAERLLISNGHAADATI